MKSILILLLLSISIHLYAWKFRIDISIVVDGITRHYDLYIPTGLEGCGNP